jgi:hypothetical protein
MQEHLSDNPPVTILFAQHFSAPQFLCGFCLSAQGLDNNPSLTSQLGDQTIEFSINDSGGKDGLIIT